MKRSTGPRKTSKLSDSLHHRLNTYALAAGAAGVGMLALVQPAEGKIVYTHANQRIPTNTVFDIDLNHDGISDVEFSFRTSSHRSVSSVYDRMRVKGIQQGNQVWEVSSAGHACAAALPKNTRVGRKRPFQPGLLTMFDAHSHAGTGSYFGPWFNTKGPRYLGLQFVIKGKTHFGWARVGIGATGYWTLISYAYETVPNKPIITGQTKGPDVISVQPGTLGRLARGRK